MAKNYVVMKDGITLKTVKTFPAAKRLADAEGASVLCEGVSVYTAEKTAAVEAEVTAEDVEATASQETEEEGALAPESDAEPEPVRYRLTSLMNIRQGPSKAAPILGTAASGTIVRVAKVKDDWLCLTDGSYVFYDGGKYAVKV